MFYLSVVPISVCLNRLPEIYQIGSSQFNLPLKAGDDFKSFSLEKFQVYEAEVANKLSRKILFIVGSNIDITEINIMGIL